MTWIIYQIRRQFMNYLLPASVVHKIIYNLYVRSLLIKKVIYPTVDTLYIIIKKTAFFIKIWESLH